MIPVQGDVVETLLRSKEPSVRLKTHLNVLSEPANSETMRKLREEVKTSSRVKLLLSERDKDGRITYHPYCKWYGAHWVLATIADLGYPPGDKSLIPLREQVYEWLLSRSHEGTAPRTHAYNGPVRIVKGRPRIHASMEGNAIYALLTLGLYDQRAERLVDRLIWTQWPDGGWNCDRAPRAKTSSFTESLIPFRALALHGKVRGSSESRKAAESAAEFFLQRHLYKRRRDDQIIRPDFVKLHHPCYWHYDILFGLKVMAEANFIKDTRCHEALDLIESKRLADGGFPAEKRYYRVTKDMRAGRSLVDWGITTPAQANEFVTVEALYVLRKAGITRLAESGIRSKGFSQ